MAAPMKNEEMSKINQKTDENLLRFDRIIDRVIGHNRKYNPDFQMTSGIPQPAKLPMELKLSKLFDSCIFKSTMSCVVGECTSEDYNCSPQIIVDNHCLFQVPLIWVCLPD